MKYFVLFKRQENQFKHAFSLINKDVFLSLPTDIIESYKEVEDIEIPTKQQLKDWTLELGGVWYENN